MGGRIHDAAPNRIDLVRHRSQSDIDGMDYSS